jgi:hypothetical protein
MFAKMVQILFGFLSLGAAYWVAKLEVYIFSIIAGMLNSNTILSAYSFTITSALIILLCIVFLIMIFPFYVGLYLLIDVFSPVHHNGTED